MRAAICQLQYASHTGFAVTDSTATLDSVCGFGGTLIAACVTPDGALVDKIEV